MENITIAALEDCDAGCLRRINELLGQLDPDARLDEKGLGEIVGSDSCRLFLIRCDGEIAGMLTVGSYLSPTGPKFWIEDVVVDKRFRGRSLGRKLVCHAVEYAGGRENATLMLTSRPERVEANSLYRSLGFRIKETNVYKMNFGK